MPGPAFVVRACLTDGACGDMLLSELVADVQADLQRRFPVVHVVDAEAGVRGAHLVHAVVAPDGEGIVVETRVDRSGTASCWVSAVRTYAAYRRVARAAMAGVRLSMSPHRVEDGVPVAEAQLSLEGGVAAARRRGSLGQFVPAGDASAIAVPVSALPVLLFAAAGLGPRPVPADRAITVLDRSQVPSSACRRWVLDWTVGRDDALVPFEGDWSVARLVDGGRLEVVDSGTDEPLRRVLGALPEPLATDAREALPPGSNPVGLTGVTAAAVFAVLALLAV